MVMITLGAAVGPAPLGWHIMSLLCRANQNKSENVCVRLRIAQHEAAARSRRGMKGVEGG